MKLIDQIAQEQLECKSIKSTSDFKSGFIAAREIIAQEIQQSGILVDLIVMVRDYGEDEV